MKGCPVFITTRPRTRGGFAVDDGLGVDFWALAEDVGADVSGPSFGLHATISRDVEIARAQAVMREAVVLCKRDSYFERPMRSAAMAFSK